MTKRNLYCCVCGSDAGRYEQHYNRDTGWGICAPCAATQAGNETPDEMDRLYGKPGVNYEQPTHVVSGRRFRVMAAFTDTVRGTARANAYMERTPGASVLFVGNGEIILADKDDKGVKA